MSRKSKIETNDNAIIANDETIIANDETIIADDANDETIIDDASDESDTFTMREICDALNIDPKIARSRFRNVYNDHVKTRYVFARSQWTDVAMIISPKRVKKSTLNAISVPLGFDA